MLLRSRVRDRLLLQGGYILVCQSNAFQCPDSGVWEWLFFVLCLPAVAGNTERLTIIIGIKSSVSQRNYVVYLQFVLRVDFFAVFADVFVTNEYAGPSFS